MQTNVVCVVLYKNHWKKKQNKKGHVHNCYVGDSHDKQERWKKNSRKGQKTKVLNKQYLPKKKKRKETYRERRKRRKSVFNHPGVFC